MTRHAPSIDAVAVRWLIDRGVWQPDKPYAENMERCARARAKWGRVGAEPGKQWAKDIVADYRAGVALPAYHVKLAMAALGMKDEPLLHPSAGSVPRADRRTVSAGDVEVAF